MIGKKLKDFNVTAYSNNKEIEVTNESIKGKWSIFMFYPADFTFVCPTELGDLADLYEQIKAEGAEVYSVSTDTHFVHKAWQDASETIKKVKFPMIGDPTGKLSKQFRVYNKEIGLNYRGTFIVNPEGEIKAYEIHDLGIGRSAKEALRKLQAAKFVAENGDKVCPANWAPGEDTLSPGLDLVGKI